MIAKPDSMNMAPPPTGSASVSFSNCRAVPEVDTRLCQPEMAPQAMVTMSIGHSGPEAVVNCVKAGKSPMPGCQITSPITPPIMPRVTIQKET